MLCLPRSTEIAILSRDYRLVRGSLLEQLFSTNTVDPFPFYLADSQFGFDLVIGFKVTTHVA